MRTLVRPGQVWASAAAGLLAGFAAWALGPPVALALLVACGVAGVLAFTLWSRAHRRWVELELADLHATVATADQLQAVERRLDDELHRVRRQLSTIDKRRAASGRRQVARLQALQNLYAMVQVRHRMPPLAESWAVAPDFMLLVVSLLQEHRPGTIVELGGGASTAWTALAVRQFGLESRLVSLDHDAGFAAVTRQRLAAVGLESIVELRHAPLVDLELDGETYPWYDRDAISDVASCDLLVVDGPPGTVRPQSRYPALRVLGDRMPPGSHVLVDDYRRDEERKVVSRWLAQLPGWTVQEFSFEKGAALLTRTGASR